MVRRQRQLVIASIFVNAVTALVFYPIITRMYDPESLANVTIIIMLNSLFGVFDVMRPVYIQEFANSLKISVKDVLFVPGAVGSGFFLVMYGLLSCFSDFAELDRVLISLALWVYILSTGCLGFLDAQGLVGMTSLFRSASTLLLFVLFLSSHFSSAAVSLPLVVSMFMTFFISLFAIRKKTFACSGVLGREFFKKAMLTLYQNIFKVIIDFLDRIFVSKAIGNGALLGIYNTLYDLSSKTNIITSVYSNSYYPYMCAGRVSRAKFLRVGLAFAYSILFCAVLFAGFGDMLLESALGRNFRGCGNDMAIFLSIASVYTLAFLYQSVYRSLGWFRKLSSIFGLCALAGLALIWPLYSIYGIKGVYVAALVLKSPGVVCFIVEAKENRDKVLFVSTVLLVLGNIALVWLLDSGLADNRF